MTYQLLAVPFLSLAACGTSSPEAAPHGDTPHGAAPHGDAREAAPAAGGTLDLSGTLEFAGAPTGTAVFVSVKDPAHPGPPLAAKQLPPGPFPLAFTLTAADVVQMGATPRGIPATVTFTARIDLDGDAMSKDPSEPVVTLETPATASGLSLTLAVPAD